MQGRGYGVLEKAKNSKKRLLKFITSMAAEEKGTLGNNLIPAQYFLKKLN